MLAKLSAAYRRHYTFILIFCLFVSFRLLTILLFRPGGFITDFSDYDFYATWGQLIPMGYRTFENLWTAYPPLFPALMLPIFELSSRIPPWIEPRLFFHILFGLAMLVFESGNFILIYRLAQKLNPWEVQHRESIATPQAVLRIPHSVLLYALLFTPVYTLTGWFEAMPLFFMLLGLDLLLSTRRGAWIGSAIAAALGFLTKLTPAVLVPIGIRWLGGRLSWTALRQEWFKPKTAGNIVRPLLYGLIFLVAMIGFGYWLVGGQTALALSSFRVNSIRPPWQSIWALLDSYYGFGLVPVDMRNLVGLTNGGQFTSHLPWTAIGIAFALLYFWLYTRGYDWQQPRTPLAFAAISVIWLFLYSKGWSPQFLVWILAFIVLLLPTMRGITYAIFLSLLNFVEADIFLILLPDEHWLMVGTVLLRTALLILLFIEFLSQVWPTPRIGQQMRQVSGVLAALVMIAGLVGAIVGAPRAAQAYGERRLAEHPCATTIAYLHDQRAWPNHTIVSDQSEVWRDFYPWLRNTYTIRGVDGYNPYDRPQAAVIADTLKSLTQDQEFWWVTQKGLATQAGDYFADRAVHVLERQTSRGCDLVRVIRLTGAPLATVAVEGGPIQLSHYEMDQPKVGAVLHLVLYWQAEKSVATSYTVFTQLFDASGKMVAQQDNPPNAGQSPTNTWAPNAIVRDPYQLAIPADAQPGAYQLLVGLYDTKGRRTLTLPDGTSHDHLSFNLDVAKP
ncbi:MAG: hypothetical protein NT075_07280 [Chloroflexi bacterium]|nr:hypothetical protein [Chloroflexota bacterium]